MTVCIYLHVFNGWYSNVVSMKYDVLQKYNFKYDYFTVSFTLKNKNNS